MQDSPLAENAYFAIRALYLNAPSCCKDQLGQFLEKQFNELAAGSPNGLLMLLAFRVLFAFSMSVKVCINMLSHLDGDPWAARKVETGLMKAVGISSRSVFLLLSCPTHSSEHICEWTAFLSPARGSPDGQARRLPTSDGLTRKP